MSDAFDWDGDSVIIPRTDAVAVYVGERGHIVIRQQQWPEDDIFITIEVRDVPAIIEAIKKQVESLSALAATDPQH